MVRNLIRNQAPGNRLRVRIPCPPLDKPAISQAFFVFTTVLTVISSLPSSRCIACSNVPGKSLDRTSSPFVVSSFFAWSDRSSDSAFE
jgi:hypothetical protein